MTPDPPADCRPDVIVKPVIALVDEATIDRLNHAADDWYDNLDTFEKGEVVGLCERYGWQYRDIYIGALVTAAKNVVP